MADVQHSTLTGSDLHEPKGVASASSGQVYEADGLGSGSWTDKVQGSIVVVESESDLPSAVAGVITLAANTLYRFVANFSMSNRLVLGDNTIIEGCDELLTTITYTGSETFLTGSDINTRIKNIKINFSSGTLFDFENTAGNEGTAIVVFENVLSDSGDTLGSADNLGILGFVVCGFFSILTDGVSFTGSDFGKLEALHSTFDIAAGDVFGLGTAIFKSVTITGISSEISAGVNFISGAASSANITSGGTGVVALCNITGAGSPLSTITTEDVRWEFESNNAIQDTRPDGLLSTSANTVTISTSNTPVLLDGTGSYTVERTSRFTGTAAGRLTYDGEKNIVVPISATVGGEPSVGTNIDFTFYFALNGTIITNSGATTTVDAGNPKNTPLLWQLELEPNDYIEVFVENNTGTNDFQCNSCVFRIN